MNIVSETSDISHWGAEAERGKPIPWLERLNDIVGMLAQLAQNRPCASGKSIG